MMTCQAIEAEIQSNKNKISELGSEEGAKVGQNVAAGVVGLFIWPVWFLMDFQDAAGKEVAAYEDRNAYLAQVSIERCQVAETTNNPLWKQVPLENQQL